MLKSFVFLKLVASNTKPPAFQYHHILRQDRHFSSILPSHSSHHLFWIYLNNLQPKVCCTQLLHKFCLHPVLVPADFSPIAVGFLSPPTRQSILSCTNVFLQLKSFITSYVFLISFASFSAIFSHYFFPKIYVCLFASCLTLLQLRIFTSYKIKNNRFCFIEKETALAVGGKKIKIPHKSLLY